jgi:malate permease and related proteins
VMIFIEVLLPLILILGLGFGLGKSGFLGREFLFGLNRLVFHVGLPALVVESLAVARWEAAAGGLFGVFALVTLLGAGLALLFSRVMGLAREQVGAFVQASFRGNLAYVALPVLLTLFAGHPERPRIMALAFLVLGPSMVLFNVLSAWVLMAGEGGRGVAGCIKVLRAVAGNPLVLASVVGMVLSLSGWGLPAPLMSGLKLVGGMSIPASLLCVGGVMALVKLGPSWKPALLASVFKVGVTPLLAWVLGRWVGLESWALMVLLVFAACPTAVASYVMAVQMGGDEAIASQAIVWSTVLCLIPLTLLLVL